MIGAPGFESGFEPAEREPSWTTVVSETEAALRQLRQATAALERASRELEALRQASETMARLDVARALGDGPDGGALAALAAAAASDASNAIADERIARAASILLGRLEAALGLERVGERGERLRLSPEHLAELDVRGGMPEPDASAVALYCVVRPGWLLDGIVVARPVVEAVSAP